MTTKFDDRLKAVPTVSDEQLARALKQLKRVTRHRTMGESYNVIRPFESRKPKVKRRRHK